MTVFRFSISFAIISLLRFFGGKCCLSQCY